MAAYPVRGCPTLAGAIAAARAHPLQARAAADSAQLAGLVLTAASWSDTEVRLAFGDRRCLHVAAASPFVQWRVEESGATLEPGGFAALVDLDWGPGRVQRFHRRTALQRRIGAACEQLFVNDSGLLLYCAGLPILRFVAIRDVDRDRDVLHYDDTD